MAVEQAARYLSEEQWFDTYYPKEWGDWRVHYNMKAFQQDPLRTGCNWMDYVVTGRLHSEGEYGQMEVREWGVDTGIIDCFFVRLGPVGVRDEDYDYLQPYVQRETQDYWCRIEVSRIESNLDLFSLYIAGCDDSSYTKHYQCQGDLWQDVETILEKCVLSQGVDAVKDMGFFFTN